jgi:hypothetical protein
MARFARLIHRGVRAFGPTFGRRRLRGQSQPELVATQGEAGNPTISVALLSPAWVKLVIRVVERCATPWDGGDDSSAVVF